MRTHRHEIGLLATLIAVLLVPLSASTATAAPAEPSSLTVHTQAAPAPEPSVEAPDEEALRTSGTLAAIVVATAVAVLAWWLFVVRRRGR